MKALVDLADKEAVYAALDVDPSGEKWLTSSE